MGHILHNTHVRRSVGLYVSQFCPNCPKNPYECVRVNGSIKYAG